MLGLRDVLLIAPTTTTTTTTTTTSSSLHQHPQPISSDHHHSTLPLPTTALGVSVGFFPLLAAAATATFPCVPQPPPPINGLETEHASSSNGFNNYWRSLKKTHELYSSAKDNLQRQIVDHDGGGFGSDGSTSVCRDCGNRAKKDCGYRRCRTCCKGRGYDCSTHVKSTWVPAARRRERQLLIGGGGGGGGSSGSSSGGAKRPRILVPSQIANTTTTASTPSASHASTSNAAPATTPRSFDSGSTHQDACFKQSLPGQIWAPAVFKCHRVSAIRDGGIGEFAYQAMVNISGHVFKGFLYDQGVDDRNAFPCISQLHLKTSTSRRRDRDSSSSSPPPPHPLILAPLENSSPLPTED